MNKTPPEFYTYILYSENHNKFYIGQTQNLEERLNRHNSGMVKSTSKYGPYVLAWYMTFPSRSLAMDRERKLKNLKSHKRLISFMNKFGTLIAERFTDPGN